MHSLPTPRIAIVTGGSRGLGRSTVLALARRGVHSVLTYHSRRAEADEVALEAGRLGARAVVRQLDVGATESVDAFASDVGAALAELGADRFGFLVNNAGTGLYKPFVETTEDELDQLYRVHVKGVFLLTQKLLPFIQEGGRIINLSSGLTRFATPGASAYAAMKGAIEVLTRYLARELGHRGVTVNTVAPGAIATDFGGGRVRDNAELNRQIAGVTALGRVGLPEDIGPMIAALLADENRWVNAQRIEASGGMNI